MVGTELGDFTSTIAFADGYLARGASRAVAAALSQHRDEHDGRDHRHRGRRAGAALTLNAPTVAGELAVARAAAAVASGRADAVLAGGVDELDPLVAEMLDALGDQGLRGEGAAFLVLEAAASARVRGAAVLGRISGAAWRSAAGATVGGGRRATSTRDRRRGGARRRDAGWLYVSASGDAERDAWEARVLAAALGAERPMAGSLGP